MMDFFRKHQKAILLLMAILMVAFLVPTIFDQNRGGGNPEIGTFVVGGETFTMRAAERQQGDLDLRIFEALGPQVRAAAGRYLGGDKQQNDGALWHIWVTLARQQNVRATSQDIKDFYRTQQLTEPQVVEVRDQLGVTAGRIEEAIGHLIALDKLTEMAKAPAMTVSEHEVRLKVRNISEAVKLNLVTPDFSAFRKVAGVPADELLYEQFRAKRDVPAFQGGYQIPDQVAMTLLVVDAEALARKNLERLDITDKMAREYYNTHLDEFRVPTTQPDAKPEIKPWDQVKDDIKLKLALAPTERQPLSPAGSLATEMLTDAQRQAGQWQSAGQSYRYGSFESQTQPADSLAGYLAKKFGYSPQVVETRLFSRRTINELAPEVSELVAGKRLISPPYAAVEVALLAAPLVKPDAQMPQGLKPLKMDENSQIFRAGNKFFIFRLSQAVRAHAPEALSQVRQQVVDDVKIELARKLAVAKLQQVEQLVADNKATLAEAVAQVNDALAAQAATQPDVVTTQPGEPAPPTAKFLLLEDAQVTRESLVDPRQEIFFTLLQRGFPFEQAQQIAMSYQVPLQFQVQPPPAAPSPEVVSKAFELAQKDGAKVALVQDPQRGVIALEQVVELLPATDADYDRLRPQVQEILLSQQAAQFANEWFSRDGLLKRVNFKLAGGERPEEQEPVEPIE